jgi:hypothetical protein
MLRILVFCLKAVIFAAVVLVLGNSFRWEGKTISDQVKVSMAHAENSKVAGTVRGWAEKLTHDAQKGIQKKFNTTSPGQMTIEVPEEITASERQKLKALIQELNSSHRKND